MKFAENEQRSPEFLKVNPKGRVPALVTEKGTLTETPALLIYIAQLAPEKKLAPLDDSFALAELQAFTAISPPRPCGTCPWPSRQPLGR